jgi:predicted enzyme related to lactoylglutathione lyase
LTWTSVARSCLHIDGEAALSWHRTSESIRWGFCATCGTTLFYVAATGRDRIYVTVGSMAGGPDQLPSAHVSYEERVSWFTPGDHLPLNKGKTSEELAKPCVHIILYVADQGRSRDFYQAVLGAAPTLDVNGMTEFALPGNAVLGLMPESGIQRLLGGLDVGSASVSRAEVYLQVPDAQPMVDRAVAAGGELLSARCERSWGAFVAYVRDPDGHILAVAG